MNSTPIGNNFTTNLMTNIGDYGSIRVAMELKSRFTSIDSCVQCFLDPFLLISPITLHYERKITMLVFLANLCHLPMSEVVLKRSLRCSKIEKATKLNIIADKMHANNMSITLDVVA